MKTKRTYKDMFKAITLAKAWMQKHPEDSKFKYALYRAVSGTERLREQYTLKLNDIQYDNCATDPETKVILTDPNGGFRYTAEGIKQRDKQISALDNTVVEIDPYYVDPKELPNDLNYEEREHFEGFVIQPQAEGAAARSD